MHEPPELDRRRRYSWEYRKTGWWFYRWYGSVGSWEPGFFAFTERRMRNKLARFIRKQRSLDRTKRATRRHS